MQKIFLAFLCFLTLITCSSFDLGKKDPDSLEVNTSNPTWDTDIQPLITAKCSSCHTNNKSQYVPSNTPNSSTLNSMNDFSTFESIAPTILRRVFNSPENPMPPNFGTPLTDAERAALKRFLETGVTSPRVRYCTSTSSQLSYPSVAPSFASNCTSCHSSSGSMASLPLENLEQIKVVRDNIVIQLAEKSMPPDASSFYTSSDRDNMLAWICGGSDLD